MLAFIEEYQPGAVSPAGRWASLGLPDLGLGLYERIREGLPFTFLSQLANLVEIDMRLLSKSVGISPSMLSRRVKAGRFTKAESDRLYLLTKVLHAANDLFEGDKKSGQ
ncbi:hypothetical protein PS673_02023 [Pseudomonas fluorescens]|jgi:putative toxin-antitoxin system antitoxin component (TIGR02293 family)|uniref:Antitoxin Xre-like helix-turn-helix domain-containing protein n=1 Tax=Pseudomonas fluorescens TaxID=294 RepID=A0A5E6SF43_PSEFL|nr:antitoxin Xre-like helix-turn-helix domain-containing protein [Pseudomonas fluorescens]VVM75965.1 hypothetical protein PS673_02023 [Pseudomonas fluorescens]